jgi:hypothetical protein
MLVRAAMDTRLQLFFVATIDDTAHYQPSPSGKVNSYCFLKQQDFRRLERGGGVMFSRKARICVGQHNIKYADSVHRVGFEPTVPLFELWKPAAHRAAADHGCAVPAVR